MSSRCNATGWAGLPVAMAGLLLCFVSTRPPTVWFIRSSSLFRAASTVPPLTMRPRKRIHWGGTSSKGGSWQENYFLFQTAFKKNTTLLISHRPLWLRCLRRVGGEDPNKNSSPAKTDSWIWPIFHRGLVFIFKIGVIGQIWTPLAVGRVRRWRLLSFNIAN